MAVKDKVLCLLENNVGEYISGENIADSLEVTRAAVWKAIKTLQKDGYDIKAVTNKGYTLSKDVDILSSSGIAKYLNNDSNIRVEVEKTVSSTNIVMRERILEDDRLVIAASEQTSGMGRLGRQFHSPSNTGFYFSILLKPQLESVEATLLTSLAAVSVCEGIKEVLDIDTKIKWVNDVFLEDKKISGILTQASFSLENNKAEYIIVGIGVNVYAPSEGFPKDIQNIAGYLLKTPIGEVKNRLLASILNSFFKYYDRFEKKEFVSVYKQNSFVLGKRVQVIKGEMVRDAIAYDMDEHCHLMVKYDDDKTDILSSGEISIRVQN